MAFSPATIVLLPVSVIVPALHVYLDKPWYLTNILSFSFAQTSIAMLKLDGFKTGGALLLGLFVYDIFWVFGTPVVRRDVLAPGAATTWRSFSSHRWSRWPRVWMLRSRSVSNVLTSSFYDPTQLDPPIRQVLAPKSMSDTSAGFSMLGLGDM
jgi:minor histocompatibility antigen H13